MTSFDFAPLYRSGIGFDRLASMLDSINTSDRTATGYPPYNIEVIDESNYTITLAVAGFEARDLDIKIENRALTVRGNKQPAEKNRRFIHQGIGHRTFERRFNLAEHIEVTGADLSNGLLTITLVREIPDAMKPRRIAIRQPGATIDQQGEGESAAH